MTFGGVHFHASKTYEIPVNACLTFTKLLAGFLHAVAEIWKNLCVRIEISNLLANISLVVPYHLSLTRMT